MSSLQNPKVLPVSQQHAPHSWLCSGPVLPWRRCTQEHSSLDLLAGLPHRVAPSAQEIARVRKAVDAIDCALQRMPSRTRRAVVLNRLEGLPAQTIGIRLGVSQATVERDLRRGFFSLLGATRDERGRKASVDPLIRVAVDWILRLESGDACASERQVFKAWLAENADHMAAWLRVAGVLKTPLADLHAVERRCPGQLYLACKALMARPGTRNKSALHGALLLLLLGLGTWARLIE